MTETFNYSNIVIQNTKGDNYSVKIGNQLQTNSQAPPV